MKRAFAIFGLVGLVGCFLPLVPGLSLWDARAFGYGQVLAVMAAFAVPMALGLATKLPAGAKLAALGCFGYLLVWKFGFDVIDLLVHGAIGAKMMAVGAIGGTVATLGSFAEAE